jgi:hypothetical protein
MKVLCKTSGYHPATGLDLVDGEMEVTDDQGAQLVAARLAVASPEPSPKKARAQREE